MADLDENLDVWERTYDWSLRGDEWSRHWGDTRALWYGALMPRIHSFVPAGTILEIAPGHGRWTAFLKDLTDRLVIVDLAERCIDHCRERFSDATNIEYHVNDGRSLMMLDDDSIDFAFSFDSLVHAEIDVVGAYLEGLAAKLSGDGAAFIHHSNLGAHRWAAEAARRAPDRLREPLIRRGLAADIGAWRSESGTAAAVRAAGEAAGLKCVGQETISWQHGRLEIDCLSMFAAPGSRWERTYRQLSTPGFARDGDRVRALYAASSFPASKRR